MDHIQIHHEEVRFALSQLKAARETGATQVVVRQTFINSTVGAAAAGPSSVAYGAVTNAPREEELDPRIVQQLDRLAKRGHEVNVEAFHTKRPHDLLLIGYDGSLLADLRLKAFPPAIAKDEFLASRLDELQDAVHAANTRIEGWRHTPYIDERALRQAVCGDAVRIQNAARIALDHLQRLLKKL